MNSSTIHDQPQPVIRGLVSAWMVVCHAVQGPRLGSLGWQTVIRQVEQWIRKILRIIFVFINNVYCIPTYAIWMLLLHPLKTLSVSLYFRIEGLFFHWLLAMVAMWSWSAGYSIVELGDDIEPCLEERTLVLANHQSTADVPLLMATFNAKRSVLPNVMWIMDRIFKFTNFGIVSILHEDFFIVSGKNKREQSLKDLVKHLHKSYIPRNRKWIILFPEGGFLRKRRETSQRYAQKLNLPVLQHVSLPRLGAMQVIMEHVGHGHRQLANARNDKDSERLLRNSSTSNHINASEEIDKDRLRWIIDITIAYPKGEPLDLIAIVTGTRPPCQTYLFYRRYALSEIPEDEEGMKKWLYDRFIEKEGVLEKFYKTGELPGKEWFREFVPPQEVTQDPLRFIILHISFITSSCVHYLFLSSVFSYIWEHLAWFSL